VLSGLHAFLEVFRAESGRGAEQDNVDVFLQQLINAVEANDLLYVLGLLRVLRLKILQGIVDLVLNHIDDRYQLHVWVRLQSLIGGSRSTAATTHQGNLQCLGDRRPRQDRRKTADESHTADSGCGTTEESSARERKGGWRHGNGF
jgi:hypothetical protein